MSQAKVNKKKRNLATFIGIIGFRIILDLIYVQLIVPIFGYSGFTSNYNRNLYIISWVILVLFIPAIIEKNNDQKNPSSLIMIILALIAFVPFTTMAAFGFFTNKFIICNVIYWFCLFFFHKLFLRVELFKVKKFKSKLNDTFIMIIGFIFLIAIVYISWRYTGFRFTFNLFGVYALRSEALTYNLPTFLDYISSSSKAVNPILLVYMLSRKKYMLASIIVVIQLLSFGINGSKTVFFITILAVWAYLFYKDKYLNNLPWIIGLLSLISLVEKHIFNTYYLVNLVIRRVMFLTTMINYNYFDFFTKNPPDYFKQSFLKYFGFQSTYDNIPYVIGWLYYHSRAMDVNSGLISDAVANIGLPGLVLMPILLTFAFRVFDNCALGVSKGLYIIPCIYIAFAFVSSFFFTVVFTHGFLIMCILLYLLPRDNHEVKVLN